MHRQAIINKLNRGLGPDSPFTSDEETYLLGVLSSLDELSRRVDGWSLTNRERDVVDNLVQGFRVSSIAKKLGLSHYTVRNHLKRIFRKAQCHSQKDLLEKLRSTSPEIESLGKPKRQVAESVPPLGVGNDGE